MTPYILSLLVASLAAALVELLAPRGEGGRLAAHVRMLAGLFLLVALLSPLQKGIALLRTAAEEGVNDDFIADYVPEITPGDYQATFGESVSTISGQQVESWVVDTLSSDFDIPAADCTVQAVCRTESGTLTLEEVRIALHGTAALRDPHPIEKQVSDTLACPCYVTVSPR